MIATATSHIDLHRGAHKIFIQELPVSIPTKNVIQAAMQRNSKVLMQGPFEGNFSKTSTRASYMDLYKIR